MTAAKMSRSRRAREAHKTALCAVLNSVLERRMMLKDQLYRIRDEEMRALEQLGDFRKAQMDEMTWAHALLQQVGRLGNLSGITSEP